jgi:hypothetical protein
MESNGERLMAWRESKSKDGRVRLDGAAMAGPPSQNPKGRRLIPV